VYLVFNNLVFNISNTSPSQGILCLRYNLPAVVSPSPHSPIPVSALCYAVFAVKQTHNIADLQAQDVDEVMGLLLADDDDGSRRQDVGDEEAVGVVELRREIWNPCHVGYSQAQLEPIKNVAFCRN
jgi:hypothetical protein